MQLETLSLTVLMVLCFLPPNDGGLLVSWESALSQNHTDTMVSSPSNPIPTFREAPAFLNGDQCPLRSRAHLNLCDPSSAHIAMTLDAAYIRGSVAALVSILHHSACPENIVFHFLFSDMTRMDFTRLIQRSFPDLRFTVYHFDISLVKDRISSSIRDALEQPLNYARIYLAQILPPCVKRIIYLDSDIIVLDDIAKLWSTNLGSHPLGAPQYCHVNLTTYFTPKFWANPGMRNVFEGRLACYFNTGVMLMDLEMWRLKGYTKDIEGWMEVQKKMRIYELGSLPPFLLVFAGDVQPIDHRWNQHGLGGDNYNGSCRTLHPGPVSLLHWSGKGKPWVRLDNYKPCLLDNLWAHYDLAYIYRENFV